MDSLQNQNTQNLNENNTSANSTTNQVQNIKTPDNNSSKSISNKPIDDEIAFESLKYDNSSMRTSMKAAQTFYGQLSKDNINNMVKYLLDGSETVPANPEIVQVAMNTLGTDYVSSSGVTTDNSTLVDLAPTVGYKATKIKWVEGGYRFLATDEGMSGLMSKRLENDLGQQTQGANYVFRSNDYVSIDVASRLAIEGKTRVCKTLEVASELWYNYNPTVLFGVQTNAHTPNRPVFIFDYEDYNTTAIQQWLDKIPSNCVFVINETKAYDAVAAIGRILNGGYYFYLNDAPMVFFLSNAQNPIRCERCVINIQDYIMNNQHKLRFGDTAEIQVMIQRYLGFNNVTARYYAVAELEMDGTYTDGRYIIQTTQNTTNFDTVAQFDAVTWGTFITNPTPSHYPLSSQKYNNKDIFTGLCLLTETLYDICTPHGYCDFNLQRRQTSSTVGNYGYATVPVCDWLVRVAMDKGVIQPIVNKTHKLNNRSVLAQKIKIFATYKAGRLLGCISEVFGSLNNLSRFSYLGLQNAVTYMLDAQNCGYYDQEFLIGLVGHLPFSPSSPTAIYAISGSQTGVGSYANGSNDTINVHVTEYAPIAAYWRVDLFGSPIASDVSVSNERWNSTISAGWRDLDKKRYVCDTTSNIATVSYRFDNTGNFTNANLIFNSYYNGNNKLTTYGILQLPSMLWDKNSFICAKFRPNAIGISSGTYPIMYSNQHLAQVYDNGSTDSYEDILFQ